MKHKYKIIDKNLLSLYEHFGMERLKFTDYKLYIALETK